MDAEVNAAVSEQQRPSEDSDRIPPFSEQPGGEQRDREADRRMGRYRAVQSAAVTPHGMDEGFNVGRMGRPEFRREVFEEIADLVGRSDAQAEHDRYQPLEVSAEAGTVLEHCRRALMRVLARGVGAHGLLLIGTGALAGIISNSSLKDVIISGIETLGLPAFMLAPIAGMMMGAATASATAGTTLASQIFGPTVVASGIAPLAAAAMTNASVFVFDGLPHGSFFHVSAGGVNMGISERLKLLGYEAINGFAMLAVSTLVFGVFRVLG